MMNILPEFESRQVLTSDELNWLTCYLDSQNRQTRRVLIGGGVIGGLQVKLVDNSIQITSGAALTSAGYILSLEHKDNITVYNKTREYKQTSKEKLAFPHLCDADDSQQNYSQSIKDKSFYFPDFKDQVLELCEKEINAVDPINPADPINAANVSGKVVLLFAEIIQRELKDCEEENCKDRGKKYIFKTIPLLISQQDALSLLQKQHNVHSTTEEVSKKAFPWLHLPNINILKPVFSNLNNANGFNEQLIMNEYLRCISDFKSNLVPNAGNIEQALININNYCSIIKKTTFNFSQSIFDLINRNITANNEKQPFLTQMVYDYLWSIVKAYQELQIAAQGLRAQCLIEEKAFPNHVLLGVVNNQNTDFNRIATTEEQIYRHPFYSQFTQTEQAILNKKVVFLIRRLRELLENFDDKIFTDEKEIRLTPGGHLFQSLSEQAVPYYLKPAVSGVWNQFASHPKLKQYITYYNNIDESKPSSTANAYNIQPSGFQGNASFFRIEGVHGKPSVAALNTVFQIRKKYGLAFEVLMLRLNEQVPFNFSFNFTVNEDIESIYQVVRAELIEQIGFNTKYLDSLPIINKEFYDGTKNKLIADLKNFTRKHLHEINLHLLHPIKDTIENAIIATNIATNNTSDFITNKIEFKELNNTVKALKADSNSYAFTNNEQIPKSKYAYLKLGYFQNLDFTKIRFNRNDTFGELINEVKANADLSKLSDINFYTQLLTWATLNDKSSSKDHLFYLALQLYCSLKLQEQYIPENFLGFDVVKYNDNLEDNLLKACDAIINHVKTLPLLITENILSKVVKGEMLDYADRIKFEDDWSKMIQIDIENKKRNGGLGVENLLDRFVQLHPGITHGCGVPNGGTYIMIYNQNNKVSADFYLPYIISSHLRPIQYTLLENKTLTLTGKVTDANDKPLAAFVKVGDAMVFTDKEGMYNCLVASNIKIKVVFTAAGFVELEKDVEIKDASLILDAKLETQEIKYTTTIKLQNQEGQDITYDLQLTNDKHETVVAEKGVLIIKELPNTTILFEVSDVNFQPSPFSIKTGSSDQTLTIKIIQIDFLLINVIDKINTVFNPNLLKSISLTDEIIKLIAKDASKGIYASEKKLPIDTAYTLHVIYNDQPKTQNVSSGKVSNDIIFESFIPLEKKEIPTWIVMKYLTTRISVPIVTRNKISKLSVNNKSIEIDGTSNIGNATISYEGMLILDSPFKNPPKIIVKNYANITAVILLVNAELITAKTDIAETGSYFTISKILKDDEIKNVTTVLPEFAPIFKKTDMTKEIFYCLLLTKDQIDKLKPIFINVQ